MRTQSKHKRLKLYQGMYVVCAKCKRRITEIRADIFIDKFVSPKLISRYADSIKEGRELSCCGESYVKVLDGVIGEVHVDGGWYGGSK